MTLQYLQRKLFTIALAILTSAAFSQFDGYVLYGHLNEGTAYLIDKDQNIAHTWNGSGSNGYAMALKANGNLVRAVVNNGNQINGAAVAGKVQELDPSGNTVWEFTYSTTNYVSHHDICLMPNGNVLLTAWYRQTNAQLQTLGYTGNNAKYPTRIIEVQQNGSNGQVVWEWNMLDHFIQDVDANDPNFGVVADNPQRMNINVQTSGGNGGPFSHDWFHVNGIDYNPDLDQIAFSSRFLSELFIIDHSTTTAEAATSTGGNAGMGGDFLYRWGNPDNYDTPGTQQIPAAVHDVRWIKNGAPNEGFLQFVNNEGGPGGSTAIDAINPPLDGYNYTRTAGTAYDPTTHDWRHEALDDSDGQSASDRMPDGNVFVALSDEYMYEVDVNDNVVWQYNDNPQKAFRYTCYDLGILALLGPNPCGTLAIEEVDPSTVGIYPNPSSGNITLTGLYYNDVERITVIDGVGREVLNTVSDQQIDLGTHPNGIYHVQIALHSGQRITKKIALYR